MDYSKGDIIAFDSYRGLLSIIVMMGHLVQIFWLPLYGVDGIIMAISGTLANYAVVGFFFLSGALICNSIKQNIKRNNRFDCGEYLISRIARIYPTLVASIIVSLICFIIIGSDSLRLADDLYVAREKLTITVLDVFRTLIMKEPGMQSINGPLWSLFIEWRLYMWAMLLTLVYFQRSWLRIPLIMIIFIYSWKLFWGTERIYAIVWVLGALMTLCKSRRLYIKGSIVLAMFCLFITIINYGVLGFSINSSNMYWVAQLCISAFFALLLLTTFRQRNKFAFFGSFSYSLYLIHFPIYLFLFAVIHPVIHNKPVPLLLVSLLSMIVVLVTSYLISLITENKIYTKNWLRKFIKLKG